MSDDTPQNVSDEVRYSPKAVDDDEWIRDFLDHQPTGVVGLVDEGAPYLVSQLFVYDDDEHVLYLHGADEGRTNRLVAETQPAEVCLTATEMGRLLPADKPVNFSVEYASVVVFGAIRLVDDDDEKWRALGQFMEKFAPQLEPGRDYDPMSQASVNRTAVYRIDVDRWSAKRGTKPPEFPGAYEYDEVRSRASETESE